jgi:hypothetical protein
MITPITLTYTTQTWHTPDQWLCHVSTIMAHHTNVVRLTFCAADIPQDVQTHITSCGHQVHVSGILMPHTLHVHIT